MHEIRINVDTIYGFHPPKVVIQENGNTLVDMPADEFLGWVRANLGMGPSTAAWRPEKNNEGDVPSPDSNRPSDSRPGTGG